MGARRAVLSSWVGAVLWVVAGAGCGDDAVPELPDAEATAADAAAADGAPAECGNGLVEEGEDCDDGATMNGDGCSNICKFECVAGDPLRGDVRCDDGNTCNGAETCGVDHACHPGTALDEGADCGDGRVCLGGNCVQPSCGDGQRQGAEECDDGNATAGDGCDDCRFSCVSTDASRDCGATDLCTLDGTCNDTTHVCTPGGDAPDGTTCGSGQICLAGACGDSRCGDGYVDTAGGETCEDGNASAGDGCEPSDCTWSCANPATDCAAAPVCNAAVCDDVLDGAVKVGQICGLTPANEGTSPAGCDAPSTCRSGACLPPSTVCGNGVVETGEQCDLGPGFNTAGSGCEPSCQFSCTTGPDTCPDANPCNGTETCGAVTVNGRPGQKCGAGTPLTLGASCGTGLICLGAPLACVTSTCGDDHVDAGRGETCEPPGTGTCDASCHSIVCGDNVLAGTEMCDDDDGTPANLDGCDASCRYELFLRMTDADISTATAPSGCTPTTNIFGRSVFSGTAVSQLNGILQDEVAAGDMNVLLQLLDVDDYTGTADPSFRIGIVSAILDTAKGAWPGTNPIDWWFLIHPAGLDANNLPTGVLTNAAVSGRQVTAGPGDVVLPLSLGGTVANLSMRSARVFATVDNPPAPNTPAPPPSLLASGTSVLQTVSANATGKGLCGNITVASLAQIPLPEALAAGGSSACDSSCGRTYTYCGSGQPVGAGCNSLLDAIIGGCSIRFFICVAVINPTQPDVAGTTGYTGTIGLGAGNKVPDAQWQNNNRAYSAFLKFVANRAHATGRAP